MTSDETKQALKEGQVWYNPKKNQLGFFITKRDSYQLPYLAFMFQDNPEDWHFLLFKHFETFVYIGELE